jgi:dihydrofolate reductase|tara:strand:- start:4574 stop:5053 length:480 start_codon:yes stop_codon:yes gene_type:complete
MKAIFATDLSGGFGYKGRLPWAKVAEDLNFFKLKTSNHIIVMGRHTWNCLPQLPYRIPIVISSIDIEATQCLEPDNHIEELLELEGLTGDKEIFLIGGATLITVEALEACDEIFHTTIKSNNKADVKVAVEVIAYLESLQCDILLDTAKCTIRRFYAQS